MLVIKVIIGYHRQRGYVTFFKMQVVKMPIKRSKAILPLGAAACYWYSQISEAGASKE